MDFQFERRICDCTAAILEAIGIPAASIHVGAIAAPTGGQSTLTTPRVEIVFRYGGIYEELRRPLDSDSANNGGPQRTFYSNHQGTLEISYVTRRTANNASQSPWLNLGREAMLRSTDAQWRRVVDDVQLGYELHRLVPGPSAYEIQSENKHDVTRDSYFLAFEVLPDFFTTT